MLETSKDLLLIILAVCILGFTIFVCWAIYYFVMILKQANQIVGDIREKIKKIEDAITSIKEKVEHSSIYLGLLAEGIKQMMAHFKEKKEKKSKK